MTFGKDLDKITQRLTEQLKQVARGSIEDVFEKAQTPRDAGGAMPVKTGQLRNSLTMEGGGTGAESFREAAQNMELGDVVRGEWKAPYAMIAELGSAEKGREGAHFVGKAAAEWEQIVADNIAKVKQK